MLRWVCPSCNSEVEAVALEVRHRCAVNRNRWTSFELRTEARVVEQESLL